MYELLLIIVVALEKIIPFSLVTDKTSSILSIKTTAFGICTKTIDDIISAAIVVKEYSTMAVMEPISKVLFKTFLAPKKL
ncbi:hypothetical protein LDJ99_02135 [Fusobacterium nucleatum]